MLTTKCAEAKNTFFFASQLDVQDVYKDMKILPESTQPRHL